MHNIVDMPFSPRAKQALTLLMGLLFFFAVFVFFTAPVPGATDLWWHIKSGQWIVEQGGLPSEDPFAYTTSPDHDIRESMVLKGYWLSQVIFHATFSLLGFEGLVILKGLIFTLIYFVLWRTLCFKGVSPAVALAMIAPTVLVIKSFDILRPQVFSFLGAVVVFYCAEKGLKALRAENQPWPKSLMLLPLVMLLWANLHPGFILSYGVFAIYGVSEALKYFLKKDSLSRQSLRNFLVLISASALATLANPNHVAAIAAALGTVKNPFNKTILENLPLWKYASYTKEPHLYGFAAVAAATAAFMAASYRAVKLSHILLYASFAAAALSSFRYYIFFVLMALAISGEYVAMRTETIFRRLKPVAVVLVLVTAVAIFGLSFKRGSVLSRPPLDQSPLPVRATEFLASQNLPAPIFNPYIWGGYLIWRLHPSYRVFIDSRMIDFAAYAEYRRVMEGDTGVLDKYGVNTVLMYPLNPLFPDTVHRALFASLLHDTRWQLVYYDYNAAIFVRSGTAPSVPALDKRPFMELLF